MAEYSLKYCQQMARARCCCQVVTAPRCWWNGCQAYYQPVTALPIVSHHINIFIFLQIFLRLRERSMLEEELFSLFKGNTKLLRSAAARVARIGWVGWEGGGCTVTIAIFTLCRQPPPPPLSCSSGGLAPGAGSWDLEI